MVREAAKDHREIASFTVDSSGAKKLKSYPFRPHLQGGSVMLSSNGKRVLVTDPDNGKLHVIARAGHKHVRSVAVCERPEQVVGVPGGGAFVSCRGDGQVVALDKDLKVVKKRKVGLEPFGLAMTPNAKTLFVTTAADAHVRALDVSTLAERWAKAVPPHPRGVAVSPSGDKAVVAHLLGVSSTVLELTTKKKTFAKLPRLRDGWPSELLDDHNFKDTSVRQAGGAYVAVMSPGGTRTFIPYMLKNSGENIDTFIPGCYANGAQLPSAVTVAAVDNKKAQVLRPMPKQLSPDKITQRMSFGLLNAMGRLGTVRAAAHDPKRARLFMVGEGSGLMMAFDTSKADPTSTPLQTWNLDAPANGVAIGPQGKIGYVHLALDNTLAVVDLSQPTASPKHVKLGETRLEKTLALGRKLFHTANDRRLAGITGVSCATCHLEGRSDGVSWVLEGKSLQTPNLTGRKDYHGKIRWKGDSASLEHAIDEAIKRVQGSGIDKHESKAIAAYIRSGEMEMAKPQTVVTAHAKKGQAIFESQGCDSCHDPSNSYTDQRVHKFRGGKFRTPSLAGLAVSAPYYHDGSKRTLAQLLASHESGNPMAVGDKLDKTQIAQLEAFLKTL